MENTATVTSGLFRFNLIARCFALLAASITCYLGWASPSSLTARILAMGGEIGMVVLATMTVAVAVGLADILINDLLPRRFALPWAARNRHTGYNLIGALYLMQAVPGMALDSAGTPGLIMYYVGSGLLCGWLAWALVIRGRDEPELLDAA